jgi:hypothetical protein
MGVTVAPASCVRSTNLTADQTEGTAATVETLYSRVIPHTIPCFIFGSLALSMWTEALMDAGRTGRARMVRMKC